MIGETLAHYRMLQKIGAGGMGEVYAAEDVILNRRVALKLLPAPLTHDEEQRTRLTREAKALAALNHPNIVAVYSVEQDQGVAFITMELVKGKTLAELLPRDGFTLERFFEIAIPLADAVAAAHAEGVVHRDLKPSNIMVTEEGRVKVLDFGLAKPAASFRQADSPTITMTEVRVVAGTFAYMSPEQARGRAVDARSDIFALGILFHEMLAGRRPFSGDSPNELLSSILKDAAPDASSIRSGIPRELSRLVRRCLAKDPARRVQTALDIRNELDDLRREIDSGELTAGVQLATMRPSRRRRVVAAAAFVIAAFGLVGWLAMKGSATRVLEVRSPRQLTFAEGVEALPTLSPDGERVAFAAGGDIWVVQASGGSAVNLTKDHAGPDDDPAWSPNGTQIAFSSDRDEPGIYLMPAIGGMATRISGGPGRAPCWSPDRTEVAYVRSPAPLQTLNMIEITSVATRTSRTFRIPRAGNHNDLSWSPDGRFFAYVQAGTRDTGISRVWLMRAADQQEFAITDGSSNDWSPAWSKDARTLFYVANRSGSMDLWQQRLTEDGEPDGAPLAISVGVGMQQAAFSLDGRRLAYSRGRPVANIWRVPMLDDREAGWQDAEQLTFDDAFTRQLDVFPDGERLVFSSDRGGYANLWMMGVHTKELLQLTGERVPDLAPRVSPDGGRVAFYSYRSGNRDIWVMPVRGGPALQLTRDEGADMFPSWSADGSRIAFYGGRAGASIELFTVPSAGGDVQQLPTGGEASKYFPQWSPDGASLAFATSEPRVYRMAAAGGAEQQLANTPIYYFRWSSDSKRLYFKRGDATNDLWALTLADGTQRRLTRLSGRVGRMGEYIAVGPAHLYFTWSSNLGDIWIMDVVTDP